jgi:6-phosphogluconolactonase/glucosamine-6-phosphate isomerase/deaminase
VVALSLGKAEIIRSALEDAQSHLPVALVARQARETLFLLDADAASLLRGR